MIWQTIFVSQTNGHIQSDPGGLVNIVGGYVIGYCEKKVHMKMCLNSELLPRQNCVNLFDSPDQTT